MTAEKRSSLSCYFAWRSLSIQQHQPIMRKTTQQNRRYPCKLNVMTVNLVAAISSTKFSIIPYTHVYTTIPDLGSRIQLASLIPILPTRRGLLERLYRLKDCSGKRWQKHARWTWASELYSLSSCGNFAISFLLRQPHLVNVLVA